MEAITKIMKSFSKSEVELTIKGEWRSELEEMIYIFSDAPSILKKESFDLLVSDIKLNNYFLMMYSIVDENENIFIELGDTRSSIRYKITYSTDHEIHLENSSRSLLILKKL